MADSVSRLSRKAMLIEAGFWSVLILLSLIDLRFGAAYLLVTLALPVAKYRKTKELSTDRSPEETVDHLCSANAPFLALGTELGAEIVEQTENRFALQGKTFSKIGILPKAIYTRVSDTLPIRYELRSWGMTVAQISLAVTKKADHTHVTERYQTRRLPIYFLLSQYIQEDYEIAVYESLGYTHEQIKNELLL